MKINLLPKEERPLKQSEVRWEFLVGLIGILFLAGVLFFSYIEATKFADFSLHYNDALDREKLLQGQVLKVQELRHNVNVLKGLEEDYLNLLDKTSTSLNKLATLADHPFRELWIESLVWQEEKVELAGYTKDMTSLSLYLNYLNELSEQALLQAVFPFEETGFHLFVIDVKGVGNK